MSATVIPETVPIIGTERKRKHKLTEQRGRQKINSQINDLKNLLPECKYVITTKASILECAVNSLTRLQTLCNQLVVYNKQLQKENRKLHAELDRLRESGVMVLPIQSDDEDDTITTNDNTSTNGTPAGFDPQLAASVGIIVASNNSSNNNIHRNNSNNSIYNSPASSNATSTPVDSPPYNPPSLPPTNSNTNTNNIVNPMNVAATLGLTPNSPTLNPSYLASLGLTMPPTSMVDQTTLLQSVAMDPFLIDYCSSSPGMPSPLHTPSPPSSSPPFSPLSPIENSFRFDEPLMANLGTSSTEVMSQSSGYTTDFDPSGFARFTKRRLLFIFLFMMPFFFSFDRFTGTPVMVDDGQPGSIYKSSPHNNRVLLGVEIDEHKVQYYWDLLRLIWYVVGGTMGVTWVINTFVWATKLADEKDEKEMFKKKKPSSTATRQQLAANFLRKGATQPLRRKIVM